MPSDADRRLEKRAGRQRAQFALWQAEEEGVPRSTVYQRLADGRYRERYRAVFSMPGAPDSRLAWYQAAVLATSTPDDPAYLSHASAAHLWGFDGCRPDEVIHVISGGHHPRDVAGILPHRTKTLPSAHVTERSGIPVTSPERTLCDLAYQVSYLQLRRAVADAVRRSLITAESLAATVFELGRFRGKRKLREVTDADGRRRKLDAVYLPGDYPVEIPVWIELDGRFAHSEVLDVNDDRAREDALVRAGWPDPIRLTWQDLVRRPDEVVARVLDAIDPRRVSGESNQPD